MKTPSINIGEVGTCFHAIFGDVSRRVDTSRRSTASSVNTVMTDTCWRVGGRSAAYYYLFVISTTHPMIRGIRRLREAK